MIFQVVEHLSIYLTQLKDINNRHVGTTKHFFPHMCSSRQLLTDLFRLRNLEGNLNRLSEESAVNRGVAARAAAATENLTKELKEGIEARLTSVEEQCGKMGAVGGEFLVLLKDKVAKMEG